MLKKVVTRLVAALAIVAGFATLSATAAYADQDCSDFAYQEDAQAAMQLGDPDDLDGSPENGIACESLPSRGASASDAAVPTGGTSTGFGGMADELAPDDTPNRVPLYGGLALAAVGIWWTATRRRRHT